MKIDSDASFIRFVYPFLFDPDTFNERVHAINGRKWQARKREQTVWDSREKFLKDELLPHLADCLNNNDDETAECLHDDRLTPTVCLWKMNHTLLQSQYGGTGGNVQWSLVRKERKIPFQFRGCQLILFGMGVGILSIEVKPESEKDSEWLDFLHYFRFIRGQRKVTVQGRKRTGFDQDTGKSVLSPFFPEPAGGVSRHPGKPDVFGDIIDSILEMGVHRGGAKNVFVPGEMLPFTALFADESEAENISHFIYRVRNFFNSSQELRPAAEHLHLDDHSTLAYAERQWFLFSLAGSVFIAFDAPNTRFFRKTLPEQLGRQYFFLFSFTLHQRFVLIRMLKEISGTWSVMNGNIARRHLPGSMRDVIRPLSDEIRTQLFRNPDMKTSSNIRELLSQFGTPGFFRGMARRIREHGPRLGVPFFKIRKPGIRKEFTHIRDEVLQFKARGFFVQVAQRDNSHRYYARLQEALQVHPLYEEVSSAVREMYEYMKIQRTERIEKRMILFTLFIGVPALIVGFLGINLRTITLQQEGMPIWEALYWVFMGMIFAIIIWFRSKD